MTTINLIKIVPEPSLQINVGQTIFSDTTDSTSSITGSVRSNGGIGVAKKLYVGTDLNVTGNITGTFAGNSISVSNGGTGATSFTANSFLLGNGTSAISSSSSSYLSNTLTLPKLISSDATDSSSVSTGAVVLPGGLGVAKKVYVGTDLNVAGNITGTFTGNLGVPIGGTGNSSFTANSVLLGNGTSTVISSSMSNLTTSVFSSTNWYTLMSRSGFAAAVTGSDPLVQSHLVGGVATSGSWTLSNLNINSYNHLIFEGEILWQPTAAAAGDFYGMSFGTVSAIFMFWNGFSSGAFSGLGTYLLKNGTAVAKTGARPEGPGPNIWFPIRVIYTRSTTNTWQLFINNVIALTYSDPNVETWASPLTTTNFVITASSGNALRMNVFTRSNNLYENSLTIPKLISTDATDSSSITTGSVVLSGGLGVAKRLYVGTDLNVTGNITGTFTGTTVGVTRGGTGATSFTANSVLLGNGTSALIASGALYSSDTLTLPKLISNDSTDSSSVSTGSVVLSGGLGVAKRLYVGTDLNVAGNITGTFTGTAISVAKGGTGATSFTTNSVLLGNGTSALIASGALYSSDTLTLPKLISNDSTDSSSVSTGSVVLSGGLGVAKRLYVGTDLNVAGNITGTFTGTAISVARGGTGATSFTANSVLLGNGTSAVIASGASYSSNTLTLPKLISNDATDSSSVSTGAVVLSGGLGVAKRLYVGTDLNVAGNITGTFTGTTIGVPRGGTGATSFTANSVLLGNGTSAVVSSSMSNSPTSIFNSTNWYTLMTRGGVAEAVTGTDPFVQSFLVNAQFEVLGNWTMNNLPLSTYNNLTFEGEFRWGGQGDYYGVALGNTSVAFNFWSGYSSGGFSGVGTYIFKNYVADSNTDIFTNGIAVAVAKTNVSPQGAGANIFFPVRFVYTRSVTNTWQAFINNQLAITYNDPDGLTWGTSGSTDVSVFSRSGGGLRISVITRANNLYQNSLSIPKIISNDATDSSSVSTGAVVLSGGLGVAKRLYVGTDLNVAGNITGTYIGTTIGVTRGGTGATSFTSNSVLLGNGTSELVSSGMTRSLVFNSENWYTLMSRSGFAASVTGTDPLVQSHLVGGVSTSGSWTLSNLNINSYSNLIFEGEILWQLNAAAAGDFYGMSFGTVTAMFMFWDGFSSGGFNGLGTYLLKDGTAVAKTGARPEGPGANIWFPIRIIYTRSTTNTWQLFVNNVLALTYNDPNVETWASSLTTSNFVITASSGGLLRMNVFTRSNNLYENSLSVPKLISSDATDSSSVSTGAVVLSGGLGVAKRLYVGPTSGLGSVSIIDGRVDNLDVSVLNKRVRVSNEERTLTYRLETANPSTNFWRNICWSSELGLFVAVAYNGSFRVMISSDGVNWLNRSAAVDDAWSSVVWSPELGLFVVVGESGAQRVMTSPDGSTWTIRAATEQTNWSEVCWSPELGLFVAVGYTGTNRVMSSSNGTTWTATNVGTDVAWYGVCWSPELALFVATGNSGVMTSTNGTTWISRTPASVRQWWSVKWSPELSLLVCVATSGTGNRVMTSPDGITWTSRTTPADNNWSSVAWSSELSLFTAVSISGTTRMMISYDGITWTLVSPASADDWWAITWSRELSVFCAVGNSGAGRVMTSHPKIPSSKSTLDVNPARINTSNLGVLTLSNTTSTTSTTTGSLITSGGIGISNTTDATSITNGGTLTTAGGIAVAKKIFAGERFTQVSGGRENSFVAISTGSGTTQSGIALDSISGSNGTGNRWNIYSDSASRKLQIFNVTTGVEAFDITNTGQVICNTAIASTNSSNGNLLVTGGISISGTTDASSSTNGGTFTTAGGMAVAKRLFVGSGTNNFGNSSAVNSSNKPLAFSVISTSIPSSVDIAVENNGGNYSTSTGSGDSIIRTAANRSLYIQNSAGNHAMRIVNNLVYVNVSNDLVYSIPTTVTSSGFMSAYIDPMGCQFFTASSEGVPSGVVTPSVFTSSSAHDAYSIPSPAQFGFCRTFINLVPGTYSFRLEYASGTDRAIATIKVNNDNIGSVDCYTPSFNRVVSTNINNVGITVSGPVKIEIQANTRNASSNGWVIWWVSAAFVRTA